jgi:hypothetical protein
MDDVVHDGLCEGGLVSFIVPVTAVTNEVNEEILMEALSIGKRKARSVETALYVVGVNVDDGNVKPPGYV